MQQSSATQSLHLCFWWLRKIVACSHSSSQCLLVSTVFGTVSSLHPTSFFMIFILVIYYVHMIQFVMMIVHCMMLLNEETCVCCHMKKFMTQKSFQFVVIFPVNEQKQKRLIETTVSAELIFQWEVTVECPCMCKRPLRLSYEQVLR